MVSILDGAVKSFKVGAASPASNNMPSAQNLQLLYKAVQCLSGTRTLDTSLAQVLELLCQDSKWQAAIAWVTRPHHKPEMLCVRHVSPTRKQALEACFRNGAFGRNDTLPYRVMREQSLI